MHYLFDDTHYANSMRFQVLLIRAAGRISKKPGRISFLMAIFDFVAPNLAGLAGCWRSTWFGWPAWAGPGGRHGGCPGLGVAVDIGHSSKMTCLGTGPGPYGGD